MTRKKTYMYGFNIYYRVNGVRTKSGGPYGYVYNTKEEAITEAAKYITKQGAGFYDTIDVIEMNDDLEYIRTLWVFTRGYQ